MSRTIVILPGEGIGPEVIAEARRVLEWAATERGVDLDLREEGYGVAVYEAHGTPIREEVLADLAGAHGVLFGATGGPEFERIPWSVRRRYGLLRIRRELGVYANLRPVRGYPALHDATPFRPGHVDRVDLVIVRELTGGVYFGEPRGIDEENGETRGFDTQVYTRSEIERIARVAFELARTRDGRLTSVDKSNVMESGRLWRQVVSETGKRDYPDVALDHILADNCGLQLVRDPTRFDVLVADNLFGDLLSDVAASIAGSLGMLPSASLSAPGDRPHRRALYEPVHGSAPDIAGRGIANPVGAILSAALALEHSLGAGDEARLVREAVAATLAAGIRTPDVAGGAAPCSTVEVGDAVLAALRETG